MNKKQIFKRYIFFILGLFVMAFGVALSAKAELGTAPVSSLPYVLSLRLPITMGTLSFILNMVFILIQISLLRRKFKPVQLLQILLALSFGFFIDASLFIISGLQMPSYIIQLVFVLLSVIVIAFGISMLVAANVLLMCGESLVLAVSQISHKEFGKLKVYFDVAMVIVSIVFSFCLFGSLQGIREGTIISAVLVGVFVRLFNKMLNPLKIQFSHVELSPKNGTGK